MVGSPSQFNLESTALYFYKSNQRINGIKNVNLIANLLLFKTNNLFKKQINIELSNNKHKNSVDFNIIEKIQFNNYIAPNLRDKNIDPCFLIQKNQFSTEASSEVSFVQATFSMEPIRLIWLALGRN